MNQNYLTKRLEKVSICIVFIFCLFSPLLFTSLKSGDLSVKEKRNLATFPDLKENNSLNKNFCKEFKVWFEDHLGFRKEFINISSWTKFKIFHLSPSEKVHIGKDGWYFYTQDHNTNIAVGDYPITEQLLEEILFCHKEMQKRLREKGIEYVVILPTSKVSIYPEKMRIGKRKVIETPVDFVADYLEKNSDIKVIRLKDCLLQEKKNRQVYYKTDTHWSHAGGYAAYKEILQKFQDWGFIPNDEMPIETNFYESLVMGEFEDMMGTRLPKEKILLSDFKNTRAQVNTDPKTDVFKEILGEDGVLRVDAARYFNNPSSQSKSVMIWGDSMFETGRLVTETLAENCSELYYVFSSNDGAVKERLLDELKPDVFVYESTERYTNLVPTRILQYLSNESKRPLGEYKNSYEQIEVFDDNINVTVKNTSNVSWDILNEVRMGIIYNGNDIGKRVNLPVGKTITPGEIYTFVVPKSLIAGLDRNKVEFLMLQEGINYFEEKCGMAK